MKATSTKRGGARPNAGRRPAGDSRRVHGTYTLPPELVAAIADRAATEGVSRSEALARCLHEWSAGREAT